jgi:predicted nucleic acid-binding protein
MYIDLAVLRHAAFIVSRDADLLDLMKDEPFRKNYPALTILSPTAFVQHVRATTGSAKP